MYTQARRLNALTMYQNNSRWSLIAIATLFFAALCIAITIVLSLIPIYLSAKTITPIPTSSPLFTLSYNISADRLNVSLPIGALPPSALLLLQRYFQNKLDSDSQTAGSTITVLSAELVEVSSGQGTTKLIQLIVHVRIDYPRSCTTIRCRNRILNRISTVVLVELNIDYSQLEQAILAGQSTTTNGAFNLYTTIMTTTVMVTSGGSPPDPGYTTASASVGRRRRRSVIQSSQISSYMPVGGCLIIGPEREDISSTQMMLKEHPFVKYLPLGVESLPAVDGHQIDLYSFLRDNKLSKSIYNQLVIQDHVVHGHYLTLGALGCLEAHVRAWQRVISVNRPMLILEDDVELDGELFDSILPYLLYSLPTNFSLLYFGNLVGKDMQSKLGDYNDLLWKVNGSNWGTYAYLISPQAAATLLDFIYPVYAQVDSMIIDIAQSQSFDVFMSKQILVKTDNTYHRPSHTQRYFIPPIIIPRIFHFIWLGNDPLSTTALKHIEQWEELHPNWQIQLWTNESIDSSNLTIYNKNRLQHSARSGRQASDMLRYEILYQYGGIYADVDFEPLKNLEPLLHGVEAFVVHESADFICNGIYGAVPAHELNERLVIQLESNFRVHENGTVNQQTGPHYMTKQIKAMKEEKKTGMKNRFQIFAPHVFFPYAWYEKDPGHPYDPSAFTAHHFRSLAELARDAEARR